MIFRGYARDAHRIERTELALASRRSRSGSSSIRRPDRSRRSGCAPCSPPADPLGAFRATLERSQRRRRRSASFPAYVLVNLDELRRGALLAIGPTPNLAPGPHPFAPRGWKRESGDSLPPSFRFHTHPFAPGFASRRRSRAQRCSRSTGRPCTSATVGVPGYRCGLGR